jgi:AraC-type transcriptional regulator N-terminus
MVESMAHGTSAATVAGMLELSRSTVARGVPASKKGPTIRPLVSGLRLLQQSACSALESTLYHPVVCLILQGQKETTFGAHRLRLQAGQFLVVSHDVPVVSRVVKAPYVALLFDVDVRVLRGLSDDLDAPAEEPARALAADTASPEFLPSGGPSGNC